MTACANCGKELPRFGAWAVGHMGESIKVCGSDCGASILEAIKKEEADTWAKTATVPQG